MKISVCTWQSCKGRFSEYIITRLKNDKERFNLDSLVIEENACIWNCHAWPSILVDWDVRPYMNPAKASFIALNNWSWWKKKKKKNKKPKPFKETKEVLKKETKNNNSAPKKETKESPKKEKGQNNDNNKKN